MRSLTENGAGTGDYGQLLEAALDYAQRGWSVIPIVPRDKRPAIPWSPYQHQAASASAIGVWWDVDPRRNVGIVTGKISGLVVLDVDGEEGLASVRGRVLPVTPVAKTGKGFHYYFAHPGFELPNAVGILPGVDVRADGGYVVAPPSIHASGRRYVWSPELSPDDVDLAPCPDWVLRFLQPNPTGKGRPVEDWRGLVDQGVGDGERNSSVARLSGHLLRKHVDPFVVLDLILCWNKVKNRPPLDDDEAAEVVDSIAKMELRRRKGGQANV